jgi:SAM-dependent methyltransferase
MPTSTSARIATEILEWGMRHPVFGRLAESYTPSFVAVREDGLSPATLREFDDGPGFLARFEGRLAPEDLANRDVLDLGCGFGGRTAYYAKQYAPRSVVGLEIDLDMVRIARAGASRLADHPRVFFVQGVGEALPFAGARFDAVLSYDVFEHVGDLRHVLEECHRVLRPGGAVYAVFPPYFGPRAHHLDFITTLPFLHHAFSVRTRWCAAIRRSSACPSSQATPRRFLR